MTMFQACAPTTDPTCQDKQAVELDRAEALFNRYICRGGATIPELLELFFKPPHATDAEDQQEALLNYLTRHAICNPSNNAAVDCDGDAPCDDPQRNYCPDPEQCPSKFYGYGLLEVIKSAIRADSMVRLPIKDLDTIQSGEPLVWDPTAVPDNPDCDPCTDNVVGAFVPQHVYEINHP